MEQEDDRSVRGTRVAIEHMHSVSFNAMVGRQRNIRNVSHRFLHRSFGLVVEIEKSDLAAEDVQANEDRRDKGAAIKVHMMLHSCWRFGIIMAHARHVLSPPV